MGAGPADLHARHRLQVHAAVGELARGVVVSHGSAAVLQWEVFTADGRFVGRTDFGWPEHGVVGEFDGKVEYGRLVPDEQLAGDAVFAEKRREDDPRAQGLTVVRWTWDDLTGFDTVAARLRRALTEPGS